jgi:hypothetical protein
VVAGTTNTAGANFTINGSQGTGTGAGGSLLFRTAPAGSSGTTQNALGTALAITAAGNVGIGTTAPAAKLHVNTNSNGVNIATVFYNENQTATGGNAVGFAFINEASGFTHWKAGIVHERTDTWARGKLHFLNSGNTAGSAGLVDSRMTIDLNGNVGIGTTAPSSKLHVAETWNASGTTFCAIKSVITDTNSAAGSDFLELYSGSATQPLKLDIQKTGQVNIYGTWTDTGNYERLSFSAADATFSNGPSITTQQSGTGVAKQLNIGTIGNADLRFATNSSWRWRVGGSTGHLIAHDDNTYDIGASGANRPRNVYVGSDVISRPSASITPANNSELVVEATSNTTLTFKLKGTDGTVRTATLTLAP